MTYSQNETICYAKLRTCALKKQLYYGRSCNTVQEAGKNNDTSAKAAVYNLDGEACGPMNRQSQPSRRALHFKSPARHGSHVELYEAESSICRRNKRLQACFSCSKYTCDFLITDTITNSQPSEICLLDDGDAALLKHVRSRGGRWTASTSHDMPHYVNVCAPPQHSNQCLR